MAIQSKQTVPTLSTELYAFFYANGKVAASCPFMTSVSGS
jgi:hypothetical protein